MIKAVFKAEIEKSAANTQITRFNKVYSFEIKDHSGVSEEGSDILCAAVSSMTMLIVNTLEEFFKAGLRVTAVDTSDGAMPCIKVDITGEYVSSREVLCTVSGFYNELLALSEEYPKNLRLEVKNSERKNHA